MGAKPGTPEYVDQCFVATAKALTALSEHVLFLQQQVDTLNRTILLLCTTAEHPYGAH